MIFTQAKAYNGRTARIVELQPDGRYMVEFDDGSGVRALAREENIEFPIQWSKDPNFDEEEEARKEKLEEEKKEAELHKENWR